MQTVTQILPSDNIPVCGRNGKGQIQRKGILCKGDGYFLIFFPLSFIGIFLYTDGE
jgi:hypothetical protein